MRDFRFFQAVKQSVFEKAETATSAIADLTNRTAEKAGEASYSAIERTKQLTDRTDRTTESFKNQLSTTAQTVSDTLIDAPDKAVGAVKGTLQKTHDWGSSTISKTVQSPMNTFFDQWADAHPKIVWAINHPLISLGLTLLLILASWSLLRAVAQFTEKAWLAILEAPLQLGRFLLRVASLGLSQLGRAIAQRLSFSNQSETPASTVPVLSPELIKPTRKQQLSELLTRLEALRQEENKLLQEVASIMASDE